MSLSSQELRPRCGMYEYMNQLLFNLCEWLYIRKKYVHESIQVYLNMFFKIFMR